MSETKISNTEKRFGKRIVLPVAGAAALGFLASLLLIENDDEMTNPGDAIVYQVESPESLSPIERSQQIEDLRATLDSLNTHLESNGELQSSDESMAVAMRHQEMVEDKLVVLEQAHQSEWRDHLEDAYAKLGDYARIVGAESIDDVDNGPSSES
ncbi:hypothetical protein [Pelagicoccus albus]|uniref:Uncharacterized protein n=1 Tax=Pelagicoccus albus TaxID=415222 RepID=A0A7X1B627_9BACT|nr:hypothetical protein [Pelagicoccus albus]MBC2606346.1 hypothetical protein [Pelagicoccus albus]